MVFFRDEGSFFEAPLEVVWDFVSSGPAHSDAHRHRGARRKPLPGNAGEYSWEQDFDGSATRFTMRWVSYHPLGIAYEVLEGPFAGSRFFLYYTPEGKRTGVSIAGWFVSPTLPEGEVEPAARRFFEVEFQQDSAAIARLVTRRSTNSPESSSKG